MAQPHPSKTSAVTKTAPLAHEDRVGEIRPVYLEALTLVERLHRRLLDVVKDEFDRRDLGDVVGLKKRLGVNVQADAAKAIKAAIKQETQLIASAGVSYNKFLAKVASDINKPDGLYLIAPEHGPGFAEQLPIERFHGVGKATSAKMHALGIKTGKDLKAQSLETLHYYFGKAGLHYYTISRGIDNRPVNNDRIRKSVGVEVTFEQDIKFKQDVIAQLQNLLQKAMRKVAEKQMVAYTLTVKIKYHDFVQITRSRTLPHAITPKSALGDTFEDLLKDTDIGRRNVRLLGVALSSLENKSGQTHFRQMDLFNDD